jgi:glycine/D-amino acid oxidase-like deaminating enzyme
MTRALDAEVVVVGAGLIGAACALRLAAEGRDVLLLDTQPLGRNASFGNAGHIATEQLFPLASAEVIRSSWRYLLDAESPLRVRAAYLLPILPWLARFVWAARPSAFARGVSALMALQKSATSDLRQLLAQAGIEHLLHMDGYARVWETPAGAHTAQSQAAVMRSHGVPAELLSGAAVHAMAPALAPGIAGAVFYPGTGHVDDPFAVCAGWVDALLRAGGRVQQARVLSIAQEQRGPVELILEQDATTYCRQLVLCAGAWSGPLAASLGYRVPLDTERGYHITLDWQDGIGLDRRELSAQPIASIERNVIMTPMSMGLRMTGTVEFGGLHLAPDPQRFLLLRRQMEALLPGVNAERASTWMGFRPSLPDHLPVLGAAPRHQGVFFAFGHQHLGLTLSGVTARLVADLVQGRKPSIDLAPYRIGRFH